jgi:hypothetical protein
MSDQASQNTFIMRKGQDVVTKLILAQPVRNTSEDYGYGVWFEGSSWFRGGAAQKSYLVYVTGDRGVDYAATGDSNDAYIRISGNNYAANDANFIIRGLNVGVNNRSGGTLGILENLISIQGKSGGTVPTMRGLTITMENYGTCATEAGGLDVISRNEANTATLSYGIRIRNDDRSSQAAVQSAINVDSHASSGGFRELIDASAAELTEYGSGKQVVLLKFQGANGTTYYLIHDTDAATAVSVATSVS